MKKIVRLTESDLIRLVKRVIKEGQQSFDVVQLTLQNIGNGMLTDGKGRNIFNKLSVFGPNEIIINGKDGINYELGETITATITLNPVWMVTGEVLENKNNVQTNFDSQTKKLTLTFKMPDERTFKQSFFPEVVLKCDNAEGGKLKIGVLLPKTGSSVISSTQSAPSSTQSGQISPSMLESYKRKYRR